MAFIGQTVSPLTSPDLLVRDVQCDPSITAGKWVRMNSLGILVLAQADNLANSNVIGLVEDKTGTTSCSLRLGGLSKDLFTSLDPLLTYFLSPFSPGDMTTILPTGSSQIVLCLGQPFNDKKFLVEKKLRLQRA